MTHLEIIQRIEKENLFIKEIFYTKKTIYECVCFDLVMRFKITNSQFKNILKKHNAKVVKEDYNGFTKRYYKIIF